jgi:hypothetical protein
MMAFAAAELQAVTRPSIAMTLFDDADLAQAMPRSDIDPAPLPPPISRTGGAQK